MAALRIVLLTDQRPGHQRLAEGLIAAIARLRPVTVTTRVARRPRLLGLPLALATNGGISPQLVLERVYRLSLANLDPPDVIVSAGAETLAANVALARHFGRPNLFYGSLRSFRAGDFAIAFSSYDRPGAAPNQIVWLKPAPHDPDAVVPLAGFETKQGRVVALVLGGPSRECRWTAAEWSRLLALTDDGDAHGLRFIVANSRRTPPEVSDAAARLARQRPRDVAFLDVRTSATSLAGVLAAADLAIVTTDSSSMVSEAIWMRRPTLAVAPEALSHRPDEARYRGWLASERRLAEVRASDLDLARAVRVAAGIVPLPDNPLDALAAVIRARMPGVFHTGGA